MAERSGRSQSRSRSGGSSGRSSSRSSSSRSRSSSSRSSSSSSRTKSAARKGGKARGRQQTNDVLSDLEQLLGRGRDELADTRRRGSRAAGGARQQTDDATARVRSRVREAGDVALAQADRVRRTAGVGPSFPILGYD